MIALSAHAAAALACNTTVCCCLAQDERRRQEQLKRQHEEEAVREYRKKLRFSVRGQIQLLCNYAGVEDQQQAMTSRLPTAQAFISKLQA